MKERTKSSYVWVYRPSSITVVPSNDVNEGRQDFSNAMMVGKLITDALRCHEADPRLRPKSRFADPARLNRDEG